MRPGKTPAPDQDTPSGPYDERPGFLRASRASGFRGRLLPEMAARVNQRHSSLALDGFPTSFHSYFVRSDQNAAPCAGRALMRRGSSWLVRLARCWACVAAVGALLGGGGRTFASQCHVAERPEWEAFEFLDLGPGAKPLARSSSSLPSEVAGRLGPQPCSGHSDGHIASSVSLDVCTAAVVVKVPAPAALWSSGPREAGRFDPRSPTFRLERPPRPAWVRPAAD
jgi:hypothetical protein